MNGLGGKGSLKPEFKKNDKGPVKGKKRQKEKFNKNGWFQK